MNNLMDHAAELVALKETAKIVLDKMAIAHSGPRDFTTATALEYLQGVLGTAADDRERCAILKAWIGIEESREPWVYSALDTLQAVRDQMLGVVCVPDELWNTDSATEPTRHREMLRQLASRPIVGIRNE